MPNQYHFTSNATVQHQMIMLVTVN